MMAGDLCHARCLDPARADKYSIDQRSRVYRFVDVALANFRDVLLVPGNHDHPFDEPSEESPRERASRGLAAPSVWGNAG